MTSAITSFIAPPVPQAAPTPPATPHTDDFAKMLSQRQAAAHVTAQRHSEPVKAADEIDTSQPALQAGSNRAQAAERQPAKADKTKQPSAKPAQDAEDTPSTEKTEASKDGEPVDPALAQWMAGLNLPPAAAPVDSGAGGAAAGDAHDKAGGKHGKPGEVIDLAAAGAKQAGKPDAEPAERLHAARDSRDKIDAVAAETSSQTEWQAAVERVHAPGEARAAHETAGVDALGAAAHTTGTHRSEATAAPVAASVTTPVNAPEFAQSLGVQVSVLARDGVQQAELHLNPAEMGPISVQIALDGTQAQVNFGADSAATRQIIEGGLPELAAALRDAGFTLSGGGVHSQARGQGEGGDSNGGNGSGRGGLSSTETEVTPRRISARVSAGGVDVYA